jgi:hypothetical protein
MNPVNWKQTTSPIDINSKPENKVDEKNKGFNTYRSNPKVDSNSSTSKLNNQSTLIKQASAHVTQNSGGNINHIKNSPPPIKLDRKTSDISETGKANQPSFTEKTGSNITPNNISRANSKEKSKEEKALERKISANVDTLKVAVYRNNEQSKSTKIELEKFEVIAKELLSKSTKSQNIDDLLKFKSDLKEISGNLNKNIYSEIKNSLDTQLNIGMNKVKIENLMKAVKAYNHEIEIFNADATINNQALKPHINFKVTIPAPKFEIIARNILNKSTAPISENDKKSFRSQIKTIKSSIPSEIYSQFKKYLDN